MRMSLNDLIYAKQFIDDTVQYCISAYEKNWSAENRVRYNSRIEKILLTQGATEVLITVKPSFMRDFSGKEKCFIYEVLRLASIEFPKIRYLVDDLRNLFKQRNFQSDRYFYLELLKDSFFAYEIFEKLTPGMESRRYYYRMLSSRFGKRRLTLQEVLSEYFFTDIIELNRPKPKKKIRHKGYRDHGSLGSEYSRTLKQQSCDWSIKEAELQKKKRREDLINLLYGAGGWE